MARAVTVNGVKLSPQEIAEEAQNHPAKSPAAAYQQAARALVIRALLLAEAERRGTRATPELVAPGKRETEDEAKIRCLVEASVAVTEPDEAACRAFYDAHTARFRSPDLFEASHILFAAHPHDAGAYAAAVLQAETVLSELAKAPQRFEALARDHSNCESKANGGRLGQIGEGELVPEIEIAMRGMDEGEIASMPVKSKFGAHILRLDRRKRGETLPFDYVHEHIAMLLAEQAWRRSVARFIEGLVANACIDGIDMTPVPARAVSVA